MYVYAHAYSYIYSCRITVEMLSQGASKVNISLVVKMSDKDAVIKALHAYFFEGKKH
jgi:aspartate kinase